MDIQAYSFIQAARLSARATAIWPISAANCPVGAWRVGHCPVFDSRASTVRTVSKAVMVSVRASQAAYSRASQRAASAWRRRKRPRTGRAFSNCADSQRWRTRSHERAAHAAVRELVIGPLRGERAKGEAEHGQQRLGKPRAAIERREGPAFIMVTRAHARSRPTPVSSARDASKRPRSPLRIVRNSSAAVNCPDSRKRLATPERASPLRAPVATMMNAFSANRAQHAPRARRSTSRSRRRNPATLPRRA